MEEEIDFKDGVERLEYLVGTNLDKIKKGLDLIPFPYAKKIIELRFGLLDGKEYTLFEIPKILNEEEKEKGFAKVYLENLNKFIIKPIDEEWNAEAVRRTEAYTIHELQELFKNIGK